MRGIFLTSCKDLLLASQEGLCSVESKEMGFLAFFNLLFKVKTLELPEVEEIREKCQQIFIK
jgi:hypothetical protein